MRLSVGMDWMKLKRGSTLCPHHIRKFIPNSLSSICVWDRGLASPRQDSVFSAGCLNRTGGHGPLAGCALRERSLVTRECCILRSDSRCFSHWPWNYWGRGTLAVRARFNLVLRVWRQMCPTADSTLSNTKGLTLRRKFAFLNCTASSNRVSTCSIFKS